MEFKQGTAEVEDKEPPSATSLPEMKLKTRKKCGEDLQLALGRARLQSERTTDYSVDKQGVKTVAFTRRVIMIVRQAIRQEDGVAKDLPSNNTTPTIQGFSAGTVNGYC
jgi:hypothetical protein